MGRRGIQKHQRADRIPDATGAARPEKGREEKAVAGSWLMIHGP